MSSQLLKLILLFLLHHCQLPQATASPPPPLRKESLPTKSGYLKVNSTTNSSLYYAYYEAQHPTTPLSETPILIWLQGGPGCSSMIGNFYEVGPWLVSSNLTLEPNPGPWNRIFGLLFIDSPIGVGLSIASSVEEIPKTEHDVAKHLYIAVKKFFKLDSNLFKERPIYLTGESYAGKYIPSFGYYVLKKNAQSNHSNKLNLRGVSIGNGLTDPISQVATHGLNAYYSGLINEKQKKVLEGLQREAIELAIKGNWSEASDARSRVLKTLQNMTGLATLLNYRRKDTYQEKLVAELLSYPEIKKALGAKEDIVFVQRNHIVDNVLHADVMKSVRNMVEYLVNNTRVLLYQGQCDLVVPVVAVEAWVKKLNWDQIGNYLEAERKIWEVNGKLVGYVQKWDDFSNAVFMDAGHLVPADQAINSQAMIEDWVLEKGFFANEQSHHFPKSSGLQFEPLGQVYV